MFQKSKEWWLAILIMALIFVFSSRPSNELPDFGGWDTVVKKSGHMLGYGLLALSYWRGLQFQRKRGWLAWLLTLVYAISDEFHQSFVTGRHASAIDVMLFDNLGALVALWGYGLFRGRAAKTRPYLSEW